MNVRTRVMIRFGVQTSFSFSLSTVAQTVKYLPAMQETRVQSQGQHEKQSKININ